MRYDSNFVVFSGLFATKFDICTAIVADYVAAALSICYDQRRFIDGKPWVPITPAIRDRKKVIGGIIQKYPFLNERAIRTALSTLCDHFLDRKKIFANRSDQRYYYTYKDKIPRN